MKMRIVKITSVMGNGDETVWGWAEGCKERAFDLSREFFDKVQIAPGSTLVCYAPDEKPEEGWETVDHRSATMQTTVFNEISVNPKYVPLERGDCYRVQVRRATKPKTAVLLVKETKLGGVYKKEVDILNICSECGYHEANLKEPSCPKGLGEICPNCGAHFTETREL
jgi:hypothetical protein